MSTETVQPTASWRTYTGAEYTSVTEISCCTIANGYLIDDKGDPIHEDHPEIAAEIGRRGKAYVDHAMSWPPVIGCDHPVAAVPAVPSETPGAKAVDHE